MDQHSLLVLEYPALKEVLARFASSDLSRQVIRDLRPSTDPGRLRLSLAQADEARSLADAGRPIPVRGLGDVAGVIAEGHRQGRALEPHELLAIERVIGAFENLRRFFATEREGAPALAELAARLLEHSAVREAIGRIVEDRIGVRDDASPRLWELRRKRHHFEEAIRELMGSLAHSKRLQPFLQERAYSVRGGRYVLPVRFDRKGHVPGILHDKSASGETAFVEPNEVVSLANELADVQVDEGREVTRLLLEVSKLVYHEEPRLRYSQNVAAWLEFTAARAAMSAALGLVAARLADDGVIRLRQARHPLLVEARAQGTLPHEVVPTTVSLGDPFRMLVVTGPNTGGKTVALKTLGLIQLMFQSGLHVPAASGTELPCLDGVYADIGDEQSLSQNLSTFSGHVRNISRIVAGATERSLVLLDELGAGTDPTEGAALGQAILDHLRERGSLVAVTTHLGTLKAYAFARADVENASVAFDPDTLRPTFELLVGQPGSSHALAIARRHGLPESVVAEGARLVAESGHERTSELMRELMRSRMAAERSRQASLDLEEASRRKLAEAEKALADASSSQRQAEREAESELDRTFDEFVAAARPHLNALKNVPKALSPHVDAIEGLVRDRVRLTPFASRRREFLDRLKKHDQVFVPRYGQVCRVEKLNRAEERLVVRVGSLSMEIGFDDVSWVTPPEP